MRCFAAERWAPRRVGGRCSFTPLSDSHPSLPCSTAKSHTGTTSPASGRSATPSGTPTLRWMGSLSSGGMTSRKLRRLRRLEGCQVRTHRGGTGVTPQPHSFQGAFSKGAENILRLTPLLVSDMCVRTARCPRYVSRTSSTPLRPVAGLFLKMPETWPLDVLLL